VESFPSLELYRHGIGLVPPTGKTDSAIWVEAEKARPLRSCTCAASRRSTCRHLKELSRQVTQWKRSHGDGPWESDFAESIWYRLAHLLFEAENIPAWDVKVCHVEADDGSYVVVTDPKGEELATYFDASSARTRLLERLGKVPAVPAAVAAEKETDGGHDFVDRAGLLERLMLFQMLPDEREMNRRGFKTQRQVWEESFWHRLAYHVVRELGKGEGTFHPAIDKKSGDFTFTFRVSGEAICRLSVERSRVWPALKLLAKAFPDQEDLAIHPVPLKSLFLITPATELDLEIRPTIRALQASGEARFFARKNLKKFTYGRLIYIPEMGVLAQLEQNRDALRRFRAPVAMKLKRSQVPSFLKAHRENLDEGTLVLDEPLRGLEVFTDFDYVEMTPEALERSWYHLAVRYGFGNQSISLRDLLKARKEGMPYLETPGGWVDLQSPAFEHLEEFAGLAESDAGKTGSLRLSTSQLLRLKARSDKPLRIAGRSKGRRELLARLLELSPGQPYQPPKGITSILRLYQTHGVDWLRFLYENRLGGLLCDDMGLGKTHQAMSLMAILKEQEGVEGSFLVACPTSVVSHWRNKIRDHAPGLQAMVYHGGERDLAEALKYDVIVTSYGILRNDLEDLRREHFPLMIFDEIQYLKNRDTLSFKAAEAIPADIKIGMTGTPIENALEELKTLFDLVLPGYFGSDEAFAERYLQRSTPPPQGTLTDSPQPLPQPALDEGRLAELRRLVAPFVLRRKKSSVLDELPDKIEDLRTCNLSSDQVGLYRDAIAQRGKELIADLKAADGRPVPYIHIFALLNLLKQICNHPALALQVIDQADDYSSGKWDLYCEILRECLDSGLKVVVFTQYLGMIKLMSRHLDELNTPYVALTGATRDRGAVIDRFNDEEDCRVFLGSLKAGGTGIDLVGGSVVIHYDRWWNAAREDQATDRVHRIGQKRVVQVFKLLTEGTLEEKIAAIIERKRELMESIVEEDDPKLTKIFTREELLELLQQV
jgi:superfamily II DNA or RNA helicase